MYVFKTNIKNVCVRARARLCAYFHGRERIGNAQLVVAAGVLPASVSFFRFILVFRPRRLP